ncbi:heme lyase CcmF/NrfE family subunit [Deinococcus cellulosilyticus]|uniref:Cytochrome c biogenesis protein CcmF n=1 Tax=Deinococcus cellulosilyticus (strain DSM 18568 / NBRC 106333 / KACC 11606 / 5516J-15) TaxID=1223518 RepID=A0A511N7M6_DEIC1|nr:heme lyase CcmF/NrfE family subunit [Deinococcus cellulosilyticus]GEM48845.1 cytochrome c biogenesis protein CcmF [Deinococcus cellulosilyticus NBRC 106333 = KACC 11606]
MTEFLGLGFSELGAYGTLSLLLALGFVLYGLTMSVLGGIKHDPRFTESGRRSAWAVFLFVSVALFVLEYAIFKDDFTVRYVYRHSMSVSPTWVKFVTLWAALEGSILLWAWVLALYTFLVSVSVRKDALRPWVMASMFFSLLFFVGINLTVASPFTPNVNGATEGLGPNPLLQNHWMMAIHPVLLYLGFVGLSVPFAYAVAALITRKLGESWITQTRTWLLSAWMFLSAAIVAGGWWSYEILGWGGYWAWDPVENASFVPWLLATAFLHSIQIQERRRMLKTWNVYLIIGAYATTVLGTFLTRSGVVESVHAFGNGPIGPVFFGFFAVLMLIGIVLASVRAPLIRDDHTIDRPISREGAFLAGNIVFLSFAVMVVLGTLFPVLMEAVRNVRTSVGPPFFNQFAIPLGLILLFLMGVGPLLPWQRQKNENLWKAMQIPVGAGVLVGIVAFVFGVRDLAVALTVALCAYNVAGLLKLTLRAAQDRGGPGKIVELFRIHPRRYGAYVAHIGLVVMALGIAFSGAYKTESELTLKANQPQQVMGKTAVLKDIRIQDFPEKRSVEAHVVLGKEDTYAKLNTYVNQPQQPVAMPFVKYHPFSDTYVTLLAYKQEENWATVRVIQTPLVSWIWIGTLVMVLGSFISLQSPTVNVQTRTRQQEVTA